jgi:MFS family permease
MAILGMGIGMVMPVMTLAVQNAVERKNLGTATSSVTFFRSIGSSLGGAIFGAILTNRLAHHIMENVGGAAGAQAAKGLSSSAASLHSLPPNVLHEVLTAFASSFHDVFLVGIPLAALAFIIALFLKEAPLRASAKDEAAGEGLEVSHGV